MAFKSTVELYSDLILPRLAEGPKTLDQLAVPAYALQQLEAAAMWPAGRTALMPLV